MTPFIIIAVFVQPPIFAPIDQNDFMDLSTFKKPEKLFTPEKKTVLTTIFVFIAVNQITE